MRGDVGGAGGARRGAILLARGRRPPPPGSPNRATWSTGGGAGVRGAAQFCSLGGGDRHHQVRSDEGLGGVFSPVFRLQLRVGHRLGLRRRRHLRPRVTPVHVSRRPRVTSVHVSRRPRVAPVHVSHSSTCHIRPRVTFVHVSRSRTSVGRLGFEPPTLELSVEQITARVPGASRGEGSVMLNNSVRTL